MALFIFSILLYAASLIWAVCLFGEYRKHDKHERSKSFGITLVSLMAVLVFYLFNFLGIETEINRRIVYDTNILILISTSLLICFAGIYVLEESDILSQKSVKVLKTIMLSLTVIDCLVLICCVFPSFKNKIIYTETVPYIISESLNLNGYLAAGGWFYIPHFAFVYSEIVLCMILLLIKIIKMPKIYTPKYIILWASAIIFFAANVFMRLQTLDFFIDISLPFITLMAFSALTIKYNDKPYFMLMAMRNVIFNRIEDPILLFDNKGILIFFNEPAKKIFGHQKGDVRHRSLERFLRENLENQVSIKTERCIEQVSVFTPPVDNKMYKLDYDVIYDNKKRLVGSLLTFTDIESLTEKYEGLDGFNSYDEITSLPSSIILQKELTEINIFNRCPYCAAVCDISGLSIIKGGLSEDFAEETLRFAASIIRSTLPTNYFVAYSCECFFIFAPTDLREEMEDYFIQIQERLENENPFKFLITISYGIAIKTNTKEDFQNVLTNAQNELFEYKMMNSEQEHKALIESIDGILESYEKDKDLSIEREIAVAKKFAKKLELSKKDTEKLLLLVKIHDIGKLSVPDRIALNRSALSLEEKTIMSLHTVKGSRIARLSSEFKDVEKEILCHHEWWNGDGFPSGLSGKDIPYLARVLALIDAYEDMTSEDVFKTAYSKEDALDEIDGRAGTQFDPDLTEVFVEMMKK